MKSNISQVMLISFSCLYFRKNFKSALQGYTFKTVADLAGCKHALPRIVCATKTHLTSESKSSVQAEELLIVRKMGRTTVMRKPFLKAFSLKTNEDKTLPVSFVHTVLQPIDKLLFNWECGLMSRFLGAFSNG